MRSGRRSSETWTRRRGGFAEEQLGRLAGCIASGLDAVKERQEIIREYVAVIAEVAATLEPGTEDITERQEQFEALIDRFEATEDPIRHGMAAVMLSFLDGLFVEEEDYEAIRDITPARKKLTEVGLFRLTFWPCQAGKPDRLSGRGNNLGSSGI